MKTQETLEENRRKTEKQLGTYDNVLVAKNFGFSIRIERFIHTERSTILTGYRSEN